MSLLSYWQYDHQPGEKAEGSGRVAPGTIVKEVERERIREGES